MSVIVVHVRSPQHPPTIGFDGESWLMCQPIFHKPIASSSLLLTLKEPSYALLWSAQEICPQGLQSPPVPPWLRKPAGYLLWIYIYIYVLYIYICIYIYIYVYGYVSIDNISYESPLTTNIPHDFETFLNVPLARHPRAELAWGLLPTLPQMSAVPDAAAPCEMVLSSSLAMSWWF